MKFSLASFNFRAALWLLTGLFCVMFLLRLGYSYSSRSRVQNTYTDGVSGSFFDNQSELRKNYASESKNAEPAAAPAGGNANAAQKYEKTASLQARTDNFSDDEKRLREISRNFDAIIQYEQRSGNPGHRVLHLMIGVRPESFDSFYVVAQQIGKVYANTVTKVDKTTEFRELNAKKASLEKALASLTDLKNRAGSISDLVGLHDKILEIERQMQELGVELGNFSAENEFCTVRFSLHERAATRTISFLGRVFDAFVWTAQYYLLVLLGLALVLVVAWLLTVVASRLEGFGKKG